MLEHRKMGFCRYLFAHISKKLSLIRSEPGCSVEVLSLDGSRTNGLVLYAKSSLRYNTHLTLEPPAEQLETSQNLSELCPQGPAW